MCCKTITRVVGIFWPKRRTSGLQHQPTAFQPDKNTRAVLALPLTGSVIHYRYQMGLCFFKALKKYRELNIPTDVQAESERTVRAHYRTETWGLISVSVSKYWIRSVDERFSEGLLWTTVGFSMTAPRFVTIKNSTTLLSTLLSYLSCLLTQ